jgi:hypothetical protein
MSRFTLINLTGHPVTLIGPDGRVLLELDASGSVARCVEDRQEAGSVEVAVGVSIPLRAVRFGAVTGLPAAENGVLYVVSRAAAEAAVKTAGRDDVVYPDGPVRDSTGRVIGCWALARAIP